MGGAMPVYCAQGLEMVVLRSWEKIWVKTNEIKVKYKLNTEINYQNSQLHHIFNGVRKGASGGHRRNWSFSPG